MTRGWRRTSRCGSPVAARVVSVALVVVAALGLDVLAEQDLGHVLEVSAVAALVGLVRLQARVRLPRLVTLVNVAVLAQPAAHALAQVTHAAAGRMPHDHVVPEQVWAVGLQIAITLVVVLVAAGEPLLEALTSSTSASLGPLLMLLVPAPVVPPTTSPAPAVPVVGSPELVLTRCLLRRGPPSALGVSTARSHRSHQALLTA